MTTKRTIFSFLDYIMKNLYWLKTLQNPDQSDYVLQVLVSNVSPLISYELKDLKVMLLRKYNKTPT